MVLFGALCDQFDFLEVFWVSLGTRIAVLVFFWGARALFWVLFDVRVAIFGFLRGSGCMFDFLVHDDSFWAQF